MQRSGVRSPVAPLTFGSLGRPEPRSASTRRSASLPLLASAPLRRQGGSHDGHGGSDSRRSPHGPPPREGHASDVRSRDHFAFRRFPFVEDVPPTSSRMTFLAPSPIVDAGEPVATSAQSSALSPRWSLAFESAPAST